MIIFDSESDEPFRLNSHELLKALLSAEEDEPAWVTAARQRRTARRDAQRTRDNWLTRWSTS